MTFSRRVSLAGYRAALEGQPGGLTTALYCRSRFLFAVRGDVSTDDMVRLGIKLRKL
jgi:hypothetical protein